MTGKVQAWYASARHVVRRALVRIRRNVAPGLRAPLGLVLIGGGAFGFLPVLGFWMIPLGIAVILLDVTALRNWLARTRRRQPKHRPDD